MYDTINFTLYSVDAPDISFLEETSIYLTNKNYCILENGISYIRGDMDNFTVLCYPDRVRVKGGSLARFYFGNNLSTLNRATTAKVISKLSDRLHLPMEKAIVNRMDIGENIITKHPPSCYLSHLGSLNYANRLMQPNGLYYNKSDWLQLVFYDKIKEYKKHGSLTLPPLYEGRNLLRYELRLKKRLPHLLNMREVRAKDLYSKITYIKVLKLWKFWYEQIEKINDTTINFENMRTKKDLYKMGIIALVDKVGGYNEFVEDLKNAQKLGAINKKQAHDIREAVKDACNTDNAIVVPNANINELSGKIKQAVAYFR